MPIEHLGYRPSEFAPILMDEVNVRNGFGYFPELDAPHFLHGFHWENPENIAYTREPDYPSTEAEQRIEARAQKILQRLEMSPPSSAVMGETSPGLFNIVDITQGVLASIPTTARGTFIEAGAYFTTLPNVPIYSIAGDCTWTILLAQTQDKTPLLGLIHAGRIEADNMLPARAIDHAKTEHGCDLKSVKLGIIPSLEPKAHIIQEKDLPRLIKNKGPWGNNIYQAPDGTYRVDVRTYVTEQYLKSGVPPENISVYLTGTYASAEKGKGFSHRKATMNNIPTQRFTIAAQLR